MAFVCKKRAVLVGCNYPNTQFRLHGCINDVFLMKNLIQTSFGFDAKDIKVLTDDPGSLPEDLPTHVNIIAALKKMVDDAKAGDVLFFHFSGHGTIIPSLEPDQPYMEHEAIVPCDLNLITDMDLRNLIKKLQVGTSFTILSDSCHSGGLIDKDKEKNGPSRVSAKGMPPPVHYKVRAISIESILSCLQTVSSGINAVSGALATGAPVVTNVIGSIGWALSGIFNKDVSIKFQPQHVQRALLSSSRSLTEDEGILLSGCQANETSADLAASELTGGKAHGAFTYAVVQVLNQNKGQSLTNKELVMQVRKHLQQQGIQQHSCLYCSDGNTDAPFLATFFPGEKRKRLTHDSPANNSNRRIDNDEPPTSFNGDRRKRAESPTNFRYRTEERRRDDMDE